MGTTIWIDGDACPAGIKEIVFRASQRLQIPVCLVANAQISTPSSPLVSAVCLAQGADAADKHILEAMSADDIVITADIPLAAEIVEKGAVAIDPRGELYTEDNVKERLSVRNFMQTLRGGGLVVGGPRPLAAADKQRFAATLDRLLTKKLKDTSEHGGSGQR